MMIATHYDDEEEEEEEEEAYSELRHFKLFSLLLLAFILVQTHHLSNDFSLVMSLPS